MTSETITAEIIDLSLISLAQIINERYTSARRSILIIERAKAQWIEDSIALASALAQARKIFESNIEFGEWCEKHGPQTLNANDRQALVRMAEDLGIMRVVLTGTARTSPHHIWYEEAKSHYPNNSRSHRVMGTKKSPARPGVAPKAKTPDPADPDPNPIDPDPQSYPDPEPEPQPKSKGPKPKLDSILRSADIIAAYLNPETRTLLGKHLGNTGDGADIRNMILWAIDNGFVNKTDISLSKLTIRAMFPQAPITFYKRYDLTSIYEREKVKAFIMPAALARKHDILNNPHDIADIIQRYWEELATKKREENAKKRLSTLKKGEQEIIMFGNVMWPRPDLASYDYDQLCAAVWTFNMLIQDLKGESSQQAMSIMHSTKWRIDYARRADLPQAASAIDRTICILANAYKENPTSQCKYPNSMLGFNKP